MEKWRIGRSINGISLNGTEWLLDVNEVDFLLFDSKDEAVLFLFNQPENEDTLEEIIDFYIFEKIVV